MAFHPATGELWAADVWDRHHPESRPCHGRHPVRWTDGRSADDVRAGFRSVLVTSRAKVRRSASPLDSHRRATGAGRWWTRWTFLTSLQWRCVPTVKSAPELDNLEVPTAFILEQNYPNPFNPSTTIRYALPEKILGCADGFQYIGTTDGDAGGKGNRGGIHEVKFDASQLPSGVYLYSSRQGITLR